MVKNHPSREKKPSFGAFANFLGINTPVVADLRLPRGVINRAAEFLKS